MEFYTDGLKSSTGSGGFEKNNFCRCRERRAVGSKIMSLPTKEFQLSITSDLCHSCEHMGHRSAGAYMFMTRGEIGESCTTYQACYIASVARSDAKVCSMKCET